MAEDRARLYLQTSKNNVAIVHQQCESFSDKPQKIWDKLGRREIDDSMWKTLFMNVNKISIAKEILETKLKSPTFRMKSIPA